MASVDIDQVDVTNMQNHPEIWMAAGTTDWTMNGEIAMRLLLLEIGHTQGAAVRGLFPGARILKDICGLDRVAWVERI